MATIKDKGADIEVIRNDGDIHYYVKSDLSVVLVGEQIQLIKAFEVVETFDYTLKGAGDNLKDKTEAIYNIISGGSATQDITVSTTLADGNETIFVHQTAAITITMPSNPTKGTRKSIIDADGNAATWNITLNGNGKNMNGAATATLTSAYEGQHWTYNGTQWNLI